jgi:protein-L-isoaspartate(D-aspartate) O-methyltransferase
MNVEQARFNMIEQQIRPWEVLDSTVLELLSNLPREKFVPHDQRALAFVDTNVVLAHGQVMMQPKQEARLLQEAGVTAKDRVLEIGTGSGYMTGLLASLAREVDTADIFPDFLEPAQDILASQGINNINYFEGDAAGGWAGNSPYDVIVLTGSVPVLPPDFIDILSPRGRLAVILGRDPIMEACLIRKYDDGSTKKVSLFDTSLPALINATPPPKFVF